MQRAFGPCHNSWPHHHSNRHSLGQQQDCICSSRSRACSRKCQQRSSRLHATPVRQPTPDVSTDRRDGTSGLSGANTLVEFHDHHKTTYSWQDSSNVPGSTASANTSSSSNRSQLSSSSISVTDERYESEEEQKSIWSTFSGGQQLLDAIKRLYLPAGYPDTVTDDYLAYQLCTVPSHITGWLSISLTTSSLLKAVGVNAGPVGATAAAAAIKWIVKDGIGAAGRLLVGGKLGLEFDDDPRRWRMMAEALTTTGLALKITTAIYPSQFLLLASLGNFTKAVGKGMGKPVFRVIQTHFAAAGNVGAVAAKEEVWEVSAQLLGYSLSLLLLNALQDTGSWQTVVGLWAIIQAVHVSCRYWALSQLRFPLLNQKRASILAHAHVRGRPLPSVADGNKQEPMLLPASAMQPCVQFGCSVAQAWGVRSVNELDPRVLNAWVGVHQHEGYLLVWRDCQGFVVLKQGCDVQKVLLRAMWQAAWLESNCRGQVGHSVWGGSSSTAGLVSQQLQSSAGREGLGVVGNGTGHGGASVESLQASLAALKQHYNDFVAEAQSVGWKTDSLVFKVGSTRVQVD
eukprot:GHUV01007456.1.p1 GENE.GHUV01007456.1~~GHUV01007456.1.p1  ORF type:complete len:570 (+),score=144.92 GHUV01007456.1:464-2173(+)